MNHKNNSVRTKLTASILISLFVSWILAGGIANYFNFLEWRNFRREMNVNAEQRDRREPRFTMEEFFTGRSPCLGGE